VGLENCIVSARACHAEYPPFTQRLSVKAAWGGSERYHLGGRTVAVDDDSYLVLNDRRTYASTLESREPVHSFTIFFRPGLAEETLGALRLSTERSLETGGESPAGSAEFAEHLRPHDAWVSPQLRRIARQVDAGLEDALWYEQQFNFLLERMLRAHHESLAFIESLVMVRKSTRREIRRRIAWSTDFINTYYMRRLGMSELARSASLSRYHFHPPVPRDSRPDAICLPAAQARGCRGAAPAHDRPPPGDGGKARWLRMPLHDVSTSAAPRRCRRPRPAAGGRAVLVGAGHCRCEQE
jgi:hypothetical protein